MFRGMLFLILLLANPFYAIGDSVGEVSARLNAKRIIDVLPEKRVAPNVMAPMAVRYIKSGDSVPSCGLLLKNGEYVDLVSPEPNGDLPACAGPLKDPIYLNLDAPYLIYVYQIEDPKAEVTRNFQLFRMDGERMSICKNDDQLTDFAKKIIKSKGVENSFKSALKKLGCIKSIK